MLQYLVTSPLGIEAHHDIQYECDQELEVQEVHMRLADDLSQVAATSEACDSPAGYSDFLTVRMRSCLKKTTADTTKVPPDTMRASRPSHAGSKDADGAPVAPRPEDPPGRLTLSALGLLAVRVQCPSPRPSPAPAPSPARMASLALAVFLSGFRVWTWTGAGCLDLPPLQLWHQRAVKLMNRAAVTAPRPWATIGDPVISSLATEC
jgi:hypothetical protein